MCDYHDNSFQAHKSHTVSILLGIMLVMFFSIAFNVHLLEWTVPTAKAISTDMIQKRLPTNQRRILIGILFQIFNAIYKICVFQFYQLNQVEDAHLGTYMMLGEELLLQ